MNTILLYDFEVITRLTYKTSDGYTGYLVTVKSKKNKK